MPLTIKAQPNAVQVSSGNFPSNIAVGDLIVFSYTNYNQSFTFSRSDFTSLFVNRNAQPGSYRVYHSVFYKIATASDANSAWSVSNYSGLAVTQTLVITGHDATAPINAWEQVFHSGGIVFSAQTTTKRNTALAIATQMSNSQTGSTYSSGTFSAKLTEITSNNYMSAGVFTDITRAAATGPGHSITVTQFGTSSSVIISIAEKASSEASNLKPDTGTFLDNRFAAGRLSWTYSHGENIAQNAYEISYRIKGSSAAYTVVTQNTSNPYRDFPINTFVDGEEYEWMVRASNATSGYGAYSALSYFTAGASIWYYGKNIVSTTASGYDGTDINELPDGTFENSNDLQYWESNSFFNSFVPSTVARDSTRAKTGSWSMKVTWSGGYTWVNHWKIPTEKGQRYILSADVWLPQGHPPVRMEPLLITPEKPLSTVAIHDVWQKIYVVFTARDIDQYIGLHPFAENPPQGMNMWVDNVTVTRAPPNEGEWVMQVRTSADGTNFGPWSANRRFFVGSRFYAKVGGTFNLVTHFIKKNGVFVRTREPRPKVIDRFM